VIRVRDYKLRSFGYVIRVQDYKLQSLSACLESTLRAVGGHSILEKGHHMKTQNKTKKQTQIENTRERERERERDTHTHTHTHGERDRHKRILNAHNREFASKIAKKLASREKPNPRMQRERKK
jgi:ABC-type Zn2+ transport system substrate-binding protein/surface adhesin